MRFSSIVSKKAYEMPKTIEEWDIASADEPTVVDEIKLKKIGEEL